MKWKLTGSLTAANILIHEDGRVQICDFGTGGLLESQNDKRTTFIGTPQYMAPQVFEALEVSKPEEFNGYRNEVSRKAQLLSVSTEN